MYTTICKTDGHRKFNAESRAPKAGTLGQPREIGWGGLWEAGSECGGHMYTCGRFMLDVWQKPSQYCQVIILQLK